jgi:predicted nucleic acid-binding protein
MRCVLDTSVLVAALRSRSGASAALLHEVAARKIELVASPAVFLEYEAVLKRERHGLAAEHVLSPAQLLNILRQKGAEQ